MPTDTTAAPVATTTTATETTTTTEPAATTTAAATDDGTSITASIADVSKGATEKTAPGVDADGKPASGNESLTPETYSGLKFPDDLPADPAILAKYIPLFQEMKLSPEMAQKFVDTQAALVKESVAAQDQAFTQQHVEWVNAAKADPEIGGVNYEKSVQTARIAIGKFASPALVSLLEMSGLGKHPEMIRAFSKIGALLREDNPGQGGPATQKKDVTEILYPTQ